MALAGKVPAKVIAADGKLRDRPGFEVDFITRGSASEARSQSPRPTVLMPVRGHWRLAWEGGTATLAPGDTASVPADTPHSVVPSMTGEASLYRVVASEDPAGPTWKG
ncbi:MAG: hypothetical protein IT545_16635 [Rhodobacteraceae bacterium]|nr:hypothetical protein [Paracoccaceae bacterium]